MVRFDDWRSRLDAHLHASRHAPFSDEDGDCAAFVIGAVEVMTGEDLTPAKRDKRRSIAKLAAEALPEIPVADAAPGDVAIIAGDAGPTFGLFQGEFIYVRTERGLGLVPRDLATNAYRVGAA